MESLRSVGLLLLLLIPGGLFAQEIADVEGFQWGSMSIKPEASVLEAYDNRVLFDEMSGATGDFYTEVAAGIFLNNLPARYDLSAKARYGYRFYSDLGGLSDDFYDAGAAVSTDENPFKWGLSADVVKSLNYNTAYDPSTGSGPDSILTDEPSRRSIARGNIAYEKQWSEKTSIMPGYDVQHYFQEFQDSGSAEWQIHTASLQLGHGYSAKTKLTLGGSYSLQVNDDEDGRIGTVEVGAESSMSDKVVWQALVGMSAADYEVSGADQGVVSNLRVVWQATEKVSAYIFGGNDFQPGYEGGAARMAYRVGYGLGWKPATRWMVGGSVLHDYQESLGSGPASPGTGEVRHFFTANCGYDVTKKLQISFSGRYIDDEFDANQTVLGLSLGYAY